MAQAQETTPYLDAQIIENDRTADVIGRVRIWQAIALLTLCLALTAVGGVVILCTRTTFIPYVVEVDRFGQVHAVGAATASPRPDERVMRYFVGGFICDARTVSFDHNLQTAAIYRVYAALSRQDPSATKMTEYMKNETTSPMKRSEEFTVSVQLETVLAQNADTWEVVWRETTYERKNGKQKGSGRYRALLNVYFAPPTAKTSEEEMRRNPLGLFVKDFSWSPIK